MDRYRQIGARIAYYRRMQGLTQEEMATRLSISGSYLSRIERGRIVSNISVGLLLNIAQELKLDVCELMRDDYYLARYHSA